MYCPSCGSEYREGYAECADCKVPLVERVPIGAKRKSRVPMFPIIPKLPDNRPLLVKIVPFLAFILGGEVVLILLFALLGVGEFTSAGRVISNREFLAQAALPLGALAFISFAVAFSFWREVPWNRHLLIVCLILVAGGQLRFGYESTSLLELGPFTFDLGIPSGVVALVFASWYFYVKANVRSYYRDLKPSGGAEVGNEKPPNAGPQADA